MIETLPQPPTDTPLHVEIDQIDVSSNIHWTSWFSLIFNILLNVGPQLRAAAILNFGTVLANASADLPIVVLGALPSMQVSLGAPVPPPGTTYSAYAGVDIVTVRFFNGTLGPATPTPDEFRIAVHTGEQT